MTKLNARMKVLAFWAITLISVLLLVEVTSYVASMNLVPTRIRGRTGRGSVEFHVAHRRQVHFFQTRLVKSAVTAGSRAMSTQSDLLMFNSVLGWDYPPDIVYRDFDGVLYRHGPAGERLTCTSFPTTAIATCTAILSPIVVKSGTIRHGKHFSPKNLEPMFSISA